MTRFTRPSCSIAIFAMSCALLSGCGGYNGSWPRLGPSAQDAQATMQQSETAAVAQIPATSLQTPVETSVMQGIRTRITQVAVTYEDAQQRATLQRRAVTAALDKADSVSGSSWSLAQLELSRLNQIDAEMTGLRADASAIAGDLAALSARGMPVTNLVTQTGTLINKITQTMNEIKETRARARGTLAS